MEREAGERKGEGEISDLTHAATCCSGDLGGASTIVIPATAK